jgi:colanic acid/amylovoran biosynthesis glycosyltransferase
MKTTTTKRKILFYVPSFPVLTETFIEGEINKLVERANLDVRVLALNGIRDKLPESLKNKVIYRKLNVITAFFGILFGISKFKTVTKTFRLINSGRKSSISNIYSFIKYLGYTRIISSIKPDFIVSHFLSDPSTLCMFVSQVLSVPYGISAHARDVTVNPELVVQKLSTAKFILVCNKNAQKSLIEQSENTNTQRIILHYHGVDIKNISERTPSVKKNIDKPSIVSIGRLVEKKGHIYLIEASKILKERGVNHLVSIIGPGPLYSELKEKIDGLGLGDCVHILGEGNGFSLNEALGNLKNADVGVFSGIKTDQGDEDGIPNVLLECAVLNVPIVSTDAGSTTDFIENEKTGLLISQKNSYLLADAIEKLLFDKDLCQRLTKNSYRKVSEEFDIDKNIVTLENILL